MIWKKEFSINLDEKDKNIELNIDDLKDVVGGQNYDIKTIGNHYFYEHVSKTDGVEGE